MADSYSKLRHLYCKHGKKLLQIISKIYYKLRQLEFPKIFDNVDSLMFGVCVFVRFTSFMSLSRG